MVDPSQARHMAENLIQCTLDLLDLLGEEVAAAHLQRALDILTQTRVRDQFYTDIPLRYPQGRQLRRPSDK